MHPSVTPHGTASPPNTEAPSTSQQKTLENALTQLQREDPSLHADVDEETGQTVLSGGVMPPAAAQIMSSCVYRTHKYLSLCYFTMTCLDYLELS